MRTLIKAAIRIVILLKGLQMLSYTYNNILSVFGYPQSGEAKTYLVKTFMIYSVATIVVALILYILWRKTDWLVRLVAGNLNETELTITSTNADLTIVSLRVVGIVLLVTTIPDLLSLIGYRWVMTSSYPGVNIPIPADEARQWISSIITLLLGIWLVLGGRGITSALDKVWHGLPRWVRNDTEK